MADVLSLDDAREAIRLPSTDTSKDAQLTATYIPAVTAVIEDLVGPVMQGQRTYVADGAGGMILLPALNLVSVDAITEAGVALTAATDYAVDAAAGIVYRGTAVDPIDFTGGRQAVEVTYTAGQYATSADVPANIRLAARIILAHLWQADQQGFRPDYGGPDNAVVVSPSGYAIPRRAEELLGTVSNRPPRIA